MNRILVCGGLLGLTSVMMGALGDHGFDLTPEKAKSLETAIRYNMIYAVLIVALALAPNDRKLHIPAYLFTAGTVLFSFSIYAALLTGIRELTYFTPAGGITIMIGWLALVWRGLVSEWSLDIKRAPPTSGSR
ncbi:MAG: DUF423 domain-containing protein [Alphaproteobacteria bacterium]|nr:DUF423 domain-containing protein [Alphaproteobacteria bacterium]